MRSLMKSIAGIALTVAFVSAGAQTVYQVEFHLLDLAADTSRLVSSERSRLQPGVLEYGSQQRFPIPEPGRYALQSLVFLLPPGEVMILDLGPTIRVVP